MAAARRVDARTRRAARARRDRCRRGRSRRRSRRRRHRDGIRNATRRCGVIGASAGANSTSESRGRLARRFNQSGRDERDGSESTLFRAAEGHVDIRGESAFGIARSDATPRAARVPRSPPCPRHASRRRSWSRPSSCDGQVRAPRSSFPAPHAVSFPRKKRKKALNAHRSPRPSAGVVLACNAAAVLAMLVALTQRDDMVVDATLRHYLARSTAAGARDEALSRLHSSAHTVRRPPRAPDDAFAEALEDARAGSSMADVPRSTLRALVDPQRSTLEREARGDVAAGVLGDGKGEDELHVLLRARETKTSDFWKKTPTTPRRRRRKAAPRGVRAAARGDARARRTTTCAESNKRHTHGRSTHVALYAPVVCSGRARRGAAARHRRGRRPGPAGRAGRLVRGARARGRVRARARHMR